MPTGTAPVNLPQDSQSRDELDRFLGCRLKPAAAPSPDAEPLSEEDILNYIDGTMDPKTHAEFERRLAQHPQARMCTAILLAARAELQAEPPATSLPARPARFVFYWEGGNLKFLRSTHEPPSVIPGGFSFVHDCGFTLLEASLTPTELTLTPSQDIEIALSTDEMPAHVVASDRLRVPSRPRYELDLHTENQRTRLIIEVR